jgi:KDO2-lipid IV(A) lauroyltransferase
MTQQVAAVWAAGIAQHPEDWHMLQKVFTADLDAARLPAPQPAATADNTAVNGPENTPGNTPP